MSDLTEITLGYYEKRIISEFVVNDMGMDLEKLGEKSFEKIFPVDFNNADLLNEHELKDEIVEVIDFIHANLPTKSSNRPIWFKTNIIDQAMNDYVGIGLLNIDKHWLKYVVCSLSFDRADQSGDTLFTIFDTNFQWIINFELSQDDSTLTVQMFEKLPHTKV